MTSCSKLQVFDNEKLGQFKGSQNFTCRVNPTGVYLVKATPIHHNEEDNDISVVNQIKEWSGILRKSSI